ncbi:MAG: radical SAM protein [Cyclobacteriaceae bacterium]
MAQKLLLVTPPFTQLNTPYPATAYLKGFLNTKEVDCEQMDLGIKVILRLFSLNGFNLLFERVEYFDGEMSDNSKRILRLKEAYLNTIEPVIEFLQDRNPTLAHLICEGNYLPEASRFDQLDDLEWAFGTMGSRDKARHLATLYLEDISDLIKETIDPHFGFSRYAERLGLSANSFDPIYKELQKEKSFIDELSNDVLIEKIEESKPTLVALSIPFPGNLFGGLRCGQWIKDKFPKITIAMGGGYANTELRSVSDPRVFEFIDYILLDDGEAPLLTLLDFLDGNRKIDSLKRTYALVNGKVQYLNRAPEKDIAQRDVGVPDYSGLPLDKYLSVIEIANPMHRLWSDGRWNKLTLAHGCYWGKCTFCDISLDYIKNYEPINASIICDRIETLIEQTGQNGFHFVDEAAPPALMRDVALEIIRRKLTVVWWTNIRFEKNFTSDLCNLLATSGCIAVSGGLEVASDRLLDLIQKGVTVKQVASVANNFTQSGIKVHAYLMYGFPTQTAQETIDSLEIVRQLFKLEVVQSGFWHQFAMTAHSPVGMYPEQFKVKRVSEVVGTFANNDLQHIDEKGGIHEIFSEGLKMSLFNYMHGIGLDEPLKSWFEFGVPKAKVESYFIESAIEEGHDLPVSDSTRIIWLGNLVEVKHYTRKKKGKSTPMVSFLLTSKAHEMELNVKESLGDWLVDMLPKLSVNNNSLVTFDEFQKDFARNGLGDIEVFMQSYSLNSLREYGLLFL